MSSSDSASTSSSSSRECANYSCQTFDPIFSKDNRLCTKCEIDWLICKECDEATSYDDGIFLNFQYCEPCYVKLVADVAKMKKSTAKSAQAERLVFSDRDEEYHIEFEQKKDTGRPSPPFSAKTCPGWMLRGNDGNCYASVPNFNFIYSWRKC